MTTIDNRVDAVCLGILVADTVVKEVERLPERGRLAEVERISLHAGGCTVNTASTLAALGLRVAVVGKVGQDTYGRFVTDVLEGRGIDTGGLIHDDGAPTSATVVAVDALGERTFLHQPGANGRLTAAELDPALVFRGRALHVGGALVLPALDGAAMAGILERARSLGVFTSLTPVWDPDGTWRRIDPCLPHLDLFCGNLAEGAAISGEHSQEAVAAWFRAQGVRNVALTRGPEGCYVANDDVAGHFPAVAVDPVDSTGAGDAFAAGALHALLAGRPLEDAARLGNAAGAFATTVFGAADTVPALSDLMPYLEELHP